MNVVARQPSNNDVAMSTVADGTNVVITSSKTFLGVKSLRSVLERLRIRWRFAESPVAASSEAFVSSFLRETAVVQNMPTILIPRLGTRQRILTHATTAD